MVPITGTAATDRVLVPSYLWRESTQLYSAMRIPTDAATVKRQCQPVMAMTAAGQPRPSRLFYITDKSSGLRFLVDTGAEVSVIPPSWRHHLKPSQFSLQARQPQTVCWYHRTYGVKALKCIPPCEFQQTPQQLNDNLSQ
ncbi:unnamed protein product [Schistocephalus solidus]|uniref:Peptidase A2 domain-containing protein n=1 Tax=Schistocephalus solidus TaxID=70667 RepID=A0A183SIQ8_SCHSO|nr:unnamed protein product [Schistocephalus solidus]